MMVKVNRSLVEQVEENIPEDRKSDRKDSNWKWNKLSVEKELRCIENSWGKFEFKRQLDGLEGRRVINRVLMKWE